ncbi:5-oxoprolinase subunit B family protein [Rhodoferax sp.]|jgi:KipI family sensor histidine kinase inhibitor|uniref:5-oxoprolinase subunit B family protein n=1 Tax=Rhodoferax sp. TaxID=50421 RepID=UPI00273150DF|nr:allophanate hydrolase subunit 1 [Rhodoferax sp.]MDP1527790.1 allophanate hydrolase subunit 1 [Rhodoferax sp.]MDP1942490.1 allophanate hydrolase subunit 1 [Rhodoferax sp.]MDP2440376.1 allophanate hydrolase subunit 1 [Rhodoferax sp.]MDP3193320.1 allophanate hydrolase subunit 1 [Rhodoferax sp.]MDP3335917.1 allophanate hydrolase subunit 1 [Rhodoferax sp.]
MATPLLQAPRLLALGDAAWTLEFGSDISTATNARVTDLADQVAQLRQTEPLLAAVTDVVPTFRSLTVHFDPLAADAERLGERLLALGQQGGQVLREGQHWHLPVCFEPSFAPDLPRLAEANGLTEAEVTKKLLDAEFRVYVIGFQPGFPYMGGLPPELSMPRLASPRQRVPAHSLAVAGEMCAVYPWDSPGGWNLLGRTPVQLFDLRLAEHPAMLAVGDRVRWYPVPLTEYERLHQLGQAGQLPRESFLEPRGAA